MEKRRGVSESVCVGDARKDGRKKKGRKEEEAEEGGAEEGRTGFNYQ